MRTWLRGAAACGCAALVLAVAVETASASRLQPSSQQVRAAWSPVTFVVGEGLGTIRCDLTLEGSFHARTFAKVREALVGNVTSASINSTCTGGVLHLLTESLPWHLRYDSFAGTLPRLTSIRFQLVGFSLWFTLLGSTCLYRSTAEAPLSVTWFRGEAFEPPEFEIPPKVTLEGPLHERQGGMCLGTITLEGTTQLTNLGSTTLVTINLV